MPGERHLVSSFRHLLLPRQCAGLWFFLLLGWSTLLPGQWYFGMRDAQRAEQWARLVRATVTYGHRVQQLLFRPDVRLHLRSAIVLGRLVLPVISKKGHARRRETGRALRAAPAPVAYGASRTWTSHVVLR